MIKVGSDFSGVGAFDQALIRLGIDYQTVFACDMDKYARDTFIHNYGEPKYYPKNVYEREIPKESLDIYMTSPPCQSFSLAGKRLGKDDKRGVLFFNSHEFIKENKPRFFIFENVKGLLSDDNGNTFNEWVNMLGGKSVNGLPVLFPYEDSVDYHLYWQVLNAKKHGVPQNRERVFLIGIRDDEDNAFQFPKEEHLTKSLKDVLEENVDEKYYLSEKMINGLINHQQFNKFNPNFGEQQASCITSRVHKMGNADNYIKVGFINQDTQASTVFSEQGIAPTIVAGTHGYSQGYVEQKLGRIIGRNEENPKSRKKGIELKQTLEINENDTSNTLTTVQKDNVVIRIGTWRTHEDGQGFREITDGNCPTIPARAREDGSGQPCIQYDVDNYRIRRLTPRECFRLMDFPDSFTWNVSDSQAYKQAGNSIVVNVLYKIIQKLKL
jgi:DNA (cytosine-5)-methyltransferase 1